MKNRVKEADGYMYRQEMKNVNSQVQRADVASFLNQQNEIQQRDRHIAVLNLEK